MRSVGGEQLGEEGIKWGRGDREREQKEKDHHTALVLVKAVKGR